MGIRPGGSGRPARQPAAIMNWRSISLILLVTALWGVTACSSRRYDSARATRPYPIALHRAQAVDVQVFRQGTNIQLVNSSATSYRNFDLWLNQRYMQH